MLQDGGSVLSISFFLQAKILPTEKTAFQKHFLSHKVKPAKSSQCQNVKDTCLCWAIMQ